MTLLRRVLEGRRLPARLSYEEGRAVLESGQRALEEGLAAHPDAEPEMLYYLAQNGSVPARMAAAAHPATPAKADRILADDADEEVRAELARKIARLLPGLPAAELSELQEQTIETLRRLAADQLPRVRAILADEIKRLDCVPHDVVLSLARDAEECVCVPILEYSPLLSDSDLLEIIASARARSALSAIARRRGLDELVSEAIVASLDIPAVATLLGNPDARIREKTMEDLVEKAESIAAWHAPLVMRTDLSVRVMRRLAGFVGTSLLERLAARHDLDEAVRSQLRRALRHRLEREDFSDPEPGQPEESVTSLYRSGKLDEEFVERAVEAGRRELVIDAIALLGGMPRSGVEKIFSSRSAKAITALAWRARLSMRIAFKIQALVLKLKAGELLPARDGVAYPLSEEEMRWHLSYFGFEAKR
jgi:uncharacterized protein (DUF2336 family)